VFEKIRIRSNVDDFERQRHSCAHALHDKFHLVTEVASRLRIEGQPVSGHAMVSSRAIASAAARGVVAPISGRPTTM
jgi:hypothetical protein